MTLITDVTRDPAPDVEQSVRVLGRYIAAFEGPNELDNVGDPGWVAKLTAYMPALSAAVREHAPGARLIGPSLVNSSSRLELPGDLPGLFNAHPYPLGQPPEPALGEARARGPAGAAARPGVLLHRVRLPQRLRRHDRAAARLRGGGGDLPAAGAGGGVRRGGAAHVRLRAGRREARAGAARIPSSTSACCATTSRRSRRSPRSRRSSRRCGPRRARAPAT